MSQPRPTDPIGSIGWTERTGGVLTARECLTLARPLLRGELSILGGRLAMVLRMHSGRRSSIDPASLVPPDSPLARDAEVAAQDRLTPALLNHSSRAYTWGAAIAALHGITFDRELLYLAAMFHDTGIPSPVPDVDFTVRSAALAREFTDSHHVPADIRELVANAITMHYTPGVGLESGAEAYLLSAAQPSMCSAYAATRYPMQSARASSRSTRGWASSGSSPGFCEPRPSKSLVAVPGTCTASP
jgi:HD domain-containing protein